MNVESLVGLGASMDQLKALLDSLTAPAVEDITPEDMELVKQARAAVGAQQAAEGER